MRSDAPRPRGGRPIAELPVEALAARAPELAKGWLLVLLGGRPLERATDLPLTAFVAGAPSICEALMRALASDDALGSLVEQGPALAQIGGNSASSAAAVEALRAVAWPMALAALSDATPSQIADLGDRLAIVAAALVSAVLESVSATDEDVTPPAFLLDDRAAGGQRPLSAVPDLPIDSLAVRRTRVEGGWRAELERRMGDRGRLGSRIGLLLVEVDGVERLWASEGEQRLTQALELTAAAVRSQIRAGDVIAHEPDGRAWVIAADAGRRSAHALAERIGEAIRRADSLHGAPLTASIGVALFPDDGRDPDTLAAAAEEAMLSARASGIGVVSD